MREERRDDHKDEKNRRLDALGLRGPPEDRDAECMHCGRRFYSWSGQVSEEASLCDYCLDRD